MSSKMSLMPNISIPRSRFKQNFNHSLDMFHGDIVPVDCFEVIPGDEFSYEIASLIRMNNPIVPIMGNIEATIHAFYVPLRLLWTSAEKFYGDPSNHDTVSSITAVNFDNITVPNVNATCASASTNSASSDHIDFVYSVQDYLGKDDLEVISSKINNSTNFSNWLTDVNISLLKERAYLQIWNDHFRPSLMVPPVLIAKGDSENSYGSASFLPSANQTIKYPFKPLKGFKKYDYFTSNTLSPQYGSSVALPLGTAAPVWFIGSSSGSGPIPSNAVADFDIIGAGTKNSRNFRATYLPGDLNLNGTLSADLSQATAATINQIRYAVQLQKYFERSNYGNRFFEILNSHYGITNPDSRLQRAERLGSHKFYINVSQVLSTAGATDDSTTKLGQPGAVSVTGDKCHLFTKSFSEPGYVMVVITTKYDRSYCSGWLREDLRKTRLEFYTPEFANLGDQSTKRLEIQSFNSSNNVYNSSSILGFQEHWAEYRYRKDLVSGSLRVGKTFDVWTLADSFNGEAEVTLGYDFLKEDRESLSRLLVTGDSGPDYICDFHANILATRELPLYSIPGLMDHFGAL